MANGSDTHPPTHHPPSPVSIYRDDVTFRDPVNAFTGLPAYRTIFWSIRFHARLFFAARRVDVSRIWQPFDTEVKVRWTATGKSRLPWQPVAVFDGVSTFKFDSNGKVFEHAVDNVALRFPPLGRRSPVFAALNMVPAVDGVPVPGGGAPCPNFEDAPMAAAGAPLASASTSLAPRRLVRRLAAARASSSVDGASDAASDAVLALADGDAYTFLSAADRVRLAAGA